MTRAEHEDAWYRQWWCRTAGPLRRNSAIISSCLLLPYERMLVLASTSRADTGGVCDCGDDDIITCTEAVPVDSKPLSRRIKETAPSVVTEDINQVRDFAILWASCLMSRLSCIGRRLMGRIRGECDQDSDVSAQRLGCVIE